MMGGYEQRTIDAADVASVTRAAIDKAEAGADPKWMALALSAIYTIAGTMDTFTTDDVWNYLAALDVPPPREKRAMGAAMRAAFLNRYIVRAGGYRPSKNPACHGRPMAIWTQKGRPR